MSLSAISTLGSALVQGFEASAGELITDGSFLDQIKGLAATNPIATGAVGALAVVGGSYGIYRLIKRSSAPTIELVKP